MQQPFFIEVPFRASSEENIQGHTSTTTTTLHIYLQYTCGIGSLNPPTKNDWLTGGHLSTRFIFEPFTHTVQVIPFQRFMNAVEAGNDDGVAVPTSTALPKSSKFHWNDYDRVLVFGDSIHQQMVEAVEKLSLNITAITTKILATGQEHGNKEYTSTMMKIHSKYHNNKNMVFNQRDVQEQPKQQQQQHVTQFYFPYNINAPLTTQNVQSVWKYNIQRYYGPKSLDNIIFGSGNNNLYMMMDQQRVDKHKDKTLEEWAFVIGSSVWDLLDDDAIASTSSLDHQDHLDGIRVMLNFLIHDFVQQYSNLAKIQIVWKSPTAMHVHRVTEDSEMDVNGVSPATATTMPGLKGSTSTPTSTTIDASKEQRVKYMSTSRTYHLYEIQKKLIDEYPFVVWLDWYWSSYFSSLWTLKGDGRHYTEEWNHNQMIMDFLED
jgi:hypothetical protein